MLEGGTMKEIRMYVCWKALLRGEYVRVLWGVVDNWIYCVLEDVTSKLMNMLLEGAMDKGIVLTKLEVLEGVIMLP